MYIYTIGHTLLTPHRRTTTKTNGEGVAKQIGANDRTTVDNNVSKTKQNIIYKICAPA